MSKDNFSKNLGRKKGSRLSKLYLSRNEVNIIQGEAFPGHHLQELSSPSNIFGAPSSEGDHENNMIPPELCHPTATE